MNSIKTNTLRSLLCVALGASGSAVAQQAEKLQMLTFGPPSLGALLPPVITAQKLDQKNGLSIDFQQRPPTAYTAQFNSGEFKVGGSAALLTVGLADLRGVKVTYLFNVFDYWGTVVTSRPEVKTLKDLEGKEIAAAKATTNFRLFEWLATQQGVDVSKLSVVNTAPPGLVGYALADRAAAVQIWEPAYSRAQREESFDPRARPEDRRELEEIQRQHELPLPRRGRAQRLGEGQCRTDPEAVRHLQGRGRLGPRPSGRGCEDRAGQGHA